MRLPVTPTSAVLFAIALVIVSATASLIAFAFGRRRRREKHFRAADEARRRSVPIVHQILAGTLDYTVGLEALRTHCSPVGSRALERALVAGDLPDALVPLRLRLCEELGLVALWQQRLSGRASGAAARSAWTKAESRLKRLAPLRFVSRAESAQNLGVARHAPSWRLLAGALDDPSLDVRAAAATALGLIHAPESFEALVERLEAVAQSSSPALSVRQIKEVLIKFPLERSLDLAPSLRHSHPRVRFLAADVIRSMVEREAAGAPGLPLAPERLAPELVEIFLGQLAVDSSPDVRARAAAVMARLADARAERACRDLLEDPKWFVRLHAVRSLGGAPRAGLLEPVTRRLTDSNWRVREAASQTLLQWGEGGIHRLLEHFLATEDAYSREQIVELLQREGLPASLVRQDGAGQERGAWQALVAQCKAGSLRATIEALDERQQEALRDRLAKSNTSLTSAPAQRVPRGPLSFQ